MQNCKLLYGVRNLKKETATDYLERKDRIRRGKCRERMVMRKQFWAEFAKTHRGLEA
jgi:hypothetical protein